MSSPAPGPPSAASPSGSASWTTRISPVLHHQASLSPHSSPGNKGPSKTPRAFCGVSAEPRGPAQFRDSAPRRGDCVAVFRPPPSLVSISLRGPRTLGQAATADAGEPPGGLGSPPRRGDGAGQEPAGRASPAQLPCWDGPPVPWKRLLLMGSGAWRRGKAILTMG